MNWLKEHFNFINFFKLVGLTVVFNYFVIGFNGLVSPEGSIYSSFFDQYFNFIQWNRHLIITISNSVAHYFNTNSYISGPQMIKIAGGIEVEIWLPCLGFGIISFWIAFIITNSGTLAKKLRWCIGGIIGITIINCFRISLFLISLDRNWQQTTDLDHHDMFNIAAYVLIALLMYTYSENSRQSLKPERKI